MSIKGVLVTLESDPERAQAAIRSLEEKAGLEVGELKGQWLPVVIESSTESEFREAFDWIGSLEGVYFVDTVFSSVEGPETDCQDLENNNLEKEE